MNASKISDLLSKINRAIENPSFPAISKLERHLLQQHLRDLYDEIDATTLKANELPFAEPVKKETIAEEPVPVKKPIIKPNDDLFIKEEPVKARANDPIKTEVIIAKKENAPVNKSEVKIETPVEKKPEKVVQVSSTLNESIKTGGSLNEKLKTSSTVEVHKKLATKPLKELIDLNKKFVLLNELFKGNTEAYTTAIAHIDTLPDYETAQAFITTQLVSNYYWDETKQSTRMFSKLVRMKFGLE